MIVKTILSMISAIIFCSLFFGVISLSTPNSVVVLENSNYSEYNLTAQATGEVNEASPDFKLKDFTKIFYIYLSRIILALAILSGILGGYMYMTSGGNPDGVKSAKEMIYGAVTGVMAVAFAYTFFEILSPGILGF